MKQPSLQKNRAFICILLTAIIVLFLLLGAFQSIPLLTGSVGHYINQAGLQLTRAQVFSKSALIMQYRPAIEQPQALSDIQVALPLFEQEQALLLTNNQQDVQDILLEAQPDYVALVASISVVLAHTNTAIDPAQVAIIVSHGRAYTFTMNKLLSVLQQQANDWDLHLVLIQEITAVLILACLGALFVLTQRQLKQPSH